MTVWQEYLLEIYDEIKVLIVGIGFWRNWIRHILFMACLA